MKSLTKQVFVIITVVIVVVLLLVLMLCHLHYLFYVGLVHYTFLCKCVIRTKFT